MKSIVTFIILLGLGAFSMLSLPAMDAELSFKNSKQEAEQYSPAQGGFSDVIVQLSVHSQTHFLLYPVSFLYLVITDDLAALGTRDRTAGRVAGDLFFVIRLHTVAAATFRADNNIVPDPPTLTGISDVTPDTPIGMGKAGGGTTIDDLAVGTFTLIGTALATVVGEAAATGGTATGIVGKVFQCNRPIRNGNALPGFQGVGDDLAEDFILHVFIAGGKIHDHIIGAIVAVVGQGNFTIEDVTGRHLR